MQKNSTHSSYSILISQRQKCLRQQTEKQDFFLPEESVIHNILNFSKALKVHKSKLLGAVEMMLN